MTILFKTASQDIKILLLDSKRVNFGGGRPLFLGVERGFSLKKGEDGGKRYLFEPVSTRSAFSLCFQFWSLLLTKR